MTAKADIHALSLDAYIRLYEQDGPFELIDGEKVILMPPVMMHVVVLRNLFDMLFQHCVAHNLGQVYTEAPFVLSYDGQWVKGARVPDLMFIAAERWAQYTTETFHWGSKPLLLVPDLVIEVVSPNDLYSALRSKVDQYLIDGVQQVWVVDPARRGAEVYTSDDYLRIAETDAIPGGTLLPGLKVALSDAFAGLDE